MPRAARCLIDDAVHYVLTRGEGDQPIFRHDGDYARYLYLLYRYSRLHALRLYHYVLLPTHVHLLVEAAHATALSAALQGINLSYAFFYRKRYGERIPLWRDRFFSAPVAHDARGLACGRSIELHPVRTGLVADPRDYFASSCRTYTDGLDNPLLTPNPLYVQLAPTADARQRYYHRLLKEDLNAFLAMSLERQLALRQPMEMAKAVKKQFGLPPLTRPPGRPRNTIGMVMSHLAILALALTGGPPVALGQASNGMYRMTQDMMTATGGRVLGLSTVTAQTALGLPASGVSVNESFRLYEGFVLLRASAEALPEAAVTVTGTVDDPLARVTVNGVAALLSGTTFTAEGIPLRVGPNTLTVTAADSLGNAVSRSVVVYLDVPQAQKTPRFSIAVRGTVDDAGAVVSVNEVLGVVDAATREFEALVPVVTGHNRLTVAATDAAGNRASRAIAVFVPPPTRPPAMPTVGTRGTPPPAVTDDASITIGGTKTAGTTIWINGVLVDGNTTALEWSAALTLVEGDNELVVVARSADGASSAEVTINVILDTQPPRVTFDPPAKTNWNPAMLSGIVDDSATTIRVNGILAHRAKRDFTISVPLAPGPNTLRLVAESPTGLVTEVLRDVVLGTVPRIAAVQPAGPALLYAGIAAPIQVSATDEEGDVIAYRVRLDDTLLMDWAETDRFPWTPSSGQLGIHALTVSVRDAYGDLSTETIHVMVIRPPIQHP